MLCSMSTLDIAVSIALGVGLAAAVGFRVFLPLLITSIAAHFEYIHLSDNFGWLGSVPAMLMLAVAAVAEVLAYYIPAVDNLLDAITTPAALIAGTLVSAAANGPRRRSGTRGYAVRGGGSSAPSTRPRRARRGRG